MSAGAGLTLAADELRAPSPPVMSLSQRAIYGSDSLESEAGDDRKMIRGRVVAPCARILGDRRRLAWAGVDLFDALHEGVADEHVVDQPAKGSGLYLYVKVDDVEAFHKAVLAAGMSPDGAPEKRPSGNREFVLRDPDGYKLVFFQKK